MCSKHIAYIIMMMTKTSILCIDNRYHIIPKMILKSFEIMKFRTFDTKIKKN